VISPRKQNDSFVHKELSTFASHLTSSHRFSKKKKEKKKKEGKEKNGNTMHPLTPALTPPTPFLYIPPCSHFIRCNESSTK